MSTRQAVRRATTESGAIRRLPALGGGLARDRGAMVEEGTTNLITNPTAGAGATTGWGVLGSNTIEAVTFADEGIPNPVVDGFEITTGFKVTLVSATNGARFSITLTAAIHAVSASVYVPSAYSLDLLRIGVDGWTGSTESEWNANLSLRDEWQRGTSFVTPVSGDLAGVIDIGAGTGTPSNDVFYIAAVQTEQKSRATSYCDGSLGTGYSWASTPHASTSTRTAGRLALDELPFDPENFSVMTWARMGWPSNAIAASNPVFFSLGTTPDWRYLSFDSGGRWSIGSTDNGVSFPETRTAPDAFSRGDIKAVYAGVDATTQEVKANGLAKVGAARTTSPDLADAVPDAGSCLGIANWCNSVILAQAYFNRRLTDDEIAYFENIDHVPYLGERVGEDMVAVLRGFEEAA